MKVDQTSKNSAITLTCYQAPGDVLMLTALVRDLKKAHPYLDIYIQGRWMELFDNNPYCRVIPNEHPGFGSKISFDYREELTNSPHTPGHFITAGHRIIEKFFPVEVPCTAFHGELYLTEAEKQYRPTVNPYWVVLCGGKTDFTTKWWNPEHAQYVVDNLKDRFDFVQLGDKVAEGVYPQHVHFPLNGALDLIGKTSLRQMISIIYNAEGVLCPVTFAMHCAAAVPKKNRIKPCVVVAGGREPAHWEAYPGHQFLHTIGQLPCCADRPCWARRAQLYPDDREWNSHQLCSNPVQVNPDLRVAQCMHMITGKKVVEAIESYYMHYTPLTVSTVNSQIETVVLS